MQGSIHRARAPLAACFLVAPLLLLGGCDQRPASEEAAPTEVSETESADLRTYRVRGQIAMLPDASNPMAELQVRHEHIPDFVGWDGKIHTNSDGVPGMKAMTMPFPVKDTGALEGLSVGDKIEFTLVTDMNARAYWLEDPIPLPPDTALNFGIKTEQPGEAP
ncbi:MAG: copper-binding protein [Phycisphaerales bacterium JB059]